MVKDYGATRALAGIDLRVERGGLFGFLGPNGAGKTTAIRILLDLIRPTSGRVTVLGFDSRRESLAVRERVGYLPGELRLYESMRGDEFLDFIDGLRPSAARCPVPADARANGSVSILTAGSGRFQRGTSRSWGWCRR